MEVQRSSPLLDTLRKLGASEGVFAGVRVAMDFGNPLEEHVYTRKFCTVFDLSHMGRILVTGTSALEFLDKVIPKDLAKAKRGFMFGPTALLNDKAGFVDDVMLYYMDRDSWLIVCNAVNVSKVLDWLHSCATRLGFNDVSIENLTERLAMIAVQGPKSVELLSKVLGLDLAPLARMQFLQNVSIAGYKLYILSRSGWTGEDGFELIGEPEHLSKIFEELVKLGAKPAGLIARDSLRIEMGFCLYGNEIDEDTTPIEARYWVFDAGKKSDYIGKQALMEKLRRGAEKVRLGIRMKKSVRLVPRKGYRVYVMDREVGYVTSGTYSPILNRCIAQAYINSSHALPGLEVNVEIRGKLYPGKLVDFPFIKL